MGSECSGYEEVHGGKGFGVRNAEGERLFAVANDLVVGNTVLPRGNPTWLHTAQASTRLRLTA